MTAAWAHLAWREGRGGVRGLRVLVACLALGVAAIATAGSLKAAFQRALTEDARALLGGDLELRQSYLPFTAAQRELLARFGTLSEVLDMRAMAQAGETRRLVEVKGVDGAYPLAGDFRAQPPQPLASLLEKHGGRWGAAVEPALLDALGVRVGGQVRLGELELDIRATIAAEPDRVATALAFGPRLLVDSRAMADSGLMLPGSLIRWAVRLALAPGVEGDTVKAALAAAFPDAPWQVRDLGEAAPGLDRLLDNLAAFLTLVGLTALLVGGIGVANAVKATLDGKLGNMAVLKALGATVPQVTLAYGTLIAALSLAGVGLGLAVGAALPWLLIAVAGDSLPLPARAGLYGGPLALAAAFGLLVAALFALAPLAGAVRVGPAALFRHLVDPSAHRLGRGALAALALLGLALGARAEQSADRRELAAVFVVAIVVILVLFRLLAWALARLAALAARRRRGLLARPAVRVALANLHRPGSAVVSMVLSLGLGLTMLVAIALTEGNLARQFGEVLPAQAPTFYFIDVQPDQAERFPALVHAAAAGAQVDMAPMVRGRISHLHGQSADAAHVAPEAQWALRGDRGLTSAAAAPPHTRLVAGEWWAADYQGPPLVSLDAGLAEGLGLRPGDNLGINVLGRELTLRVASLRAVEWTSLNMNFALVLSPGALAGAPLTYIATVHAPPGREGAVERAVTDALPNVSAIRVADAVGQVRAMIANADLAVRLAGLVTLAAGTLVLAGAVLAGHRRRVREAVILKVLGATRGELWRAWLLEFAVIGTATGLTAALFGSVAAWAILVRVMRADWAFLPGLTAVTVAACLLASLLAGFAGAFVALRAKAAPLLREE